MYIWIGAKLPDAFGREVRSLCVRYNQQIGLDMVAFSLPQHISLKISFEVQQPELILEGIAAILSKQSPFAVHIKNPERVEPFPER